MPPTNDEETSSGSTAVNGFQNLISLKWHTKFKKGQLLYYEDENTHYIALPLFHVADGETLVRSFMHDREGPGACDSQADKVDQFCFGATLEGLSHKKLQSVAWLDEGSYVEGTWRSRGRSLPLTAYDLYCKLSKRRYGPRTASHIIEPNARYLALSAPGNLEKSYGDEADAERRLIFVADLDRDSIYALISTVSQNQAFALRAAIFRHLAYETLIAVAFTWEGLLRFRLAFHLPYYAWRRSDKTIQDPREYRNGDPLRHTQDVSFLRWDEAHTSLDFLCEAQVSCVVAGADNWRWEAYCFVDTYFQADEEKESVERYYDEANEEEGMYSDPLTNGRKEAGKPIRDPREYFLTVFQYRLRQVKEEWQLVVEKVYQSTRKYGQLSHPAVSLSKKHSSDQAARRHYQEVEGCLNFTRKARQLSKDLSQALSKTVNACERFSSSHAITFQDLGDSENGLRSVPVIQETMEELEALRKTLEGVAMRCEDFTRDLELHLTHATIDVGNRQRQLAQENKTLSLVMILFISPIALTAAVFSMQPTVLPFIPQNPRSFVVFICILVAVAVLFTFIQPQRLNLRQYLPFLPRKTAQFPCVPRIKCIKSLRFRKGPAEDDIEARAADVLETAGASSGQDLSSAFARSRQAFC